MQTKADLERSGLVFKQGDKVNVHFEHNATEYNAVISVCNHCHFEYCHTDIKYNKELDAIMARE